MKSSALILVTLLVACSADTGKWDKFRVTWGFTGESLVNILNFFEIYTRIEDANTFRWLNVSNENEFNLQAVAIDAEDYRVMPLYSRTGFVSGLQVSVPVKDVEESTPKSYNLETFPVYEKKTIYGVEHWTSTFYIVNPETLRNGGRDTAQPLGDGLWFKTTRGHNQILTSESDLKTQGLYTEQACIPFMGMHYYYNMTKETDCDRVEPYFLLIRDERVVGLGHQFYGRTKPVVRNWYDDIDRAAVQLTVPHAPDCLGDHAQNDGIISIHFYFEEYPWRMFC